MLLYLPWPQNLHTACLPAWISWRLRRKMVLKELKLSHMQAGCLFRQNQVLETLQKLYATSMERLWECLWGAEKDLSKVHPSIQRHNNQMSTDELIVLYTCFSISVMNLSSNFIVLHEIGKIHKALTSLIVRKSQFIKQLSKASVSFLCALPELTLIIS